MRDRFGSFVLSDRQREILDFVQRFTDRHGFCPTFREVLRGTSCTSTSNVSYNVDVLKREGFVACERGIPRTLRVVADFESPGLG